MRLKQEPHLEGETMGVLGPTTFIRFHTYLASIGKVAILVVGINGRDGDFMGISIQEFFILRRSGKEVGRYSVARRA
jgi:tartrate dehydratase beta subunit/fumarate hydratase class I family protein